jgi:hypothetical protein
MSDRELWKDEKPQRREGVLFWQNLSEDLQVCLQEGSSATRIEKTSL